MQIIYVEKAIINHPRVERIISSFKTKHVIQCEHYGEIFNRRQQNFRQQKANPALILAQKTGKKVLVTPPGFGIGSQHNYYFSHLLNCPFDCRYCFLQGMLQSAHYVFFINFEDFMQEIDGICNKLKEPITFFSGYDADSLAYEPVTGFLKDFLPFFAKYPGAELELRTKSANVRQLLQYPANPNCIVAFSLTPEVISTAVEHKVPALNKRLKAMNDVAKQGYPIGLRFDPLIYHQDFKALYQQLLEQTFNHVDATQLHSISMGPMRFPEKMFQKIQSLYPQDALVNQPLEKNNNIRSYPKDIESTMQDTLLELLKHFAPNTPVFSCTSS